MVICLNYSVSLIAYLFLKGVRVNVSITSKQPPHTSSGY